MEMNAIEISASRRLLSLIGHESLNKCKEGSYSLSAPRGVLHIPNRCTQEMLVTRDPVSLLLGDS